MAEISLGAFRAFSFCLFASVDAHSECAWSAPQDRRPPRAGAHTPPRQPGRRASNPGTANLRISPRRTRQKTWRAPRAPAPHSLQPFFQTPRPPPCSREGAHVVPRSRSAPPRLHPRGFPSRSLLPPPSALSGVENTSCFGQPGPKLSRGDKKNQSQGMSPPAVKPPAASPAPLSSRNPRTGCKSLQHFWGAEGGGERVAPGLGRRCRLARGPGPRAPGACSGPPPAPRPGSRRPLLSPSRSRLPLLVLE
ncbi:serine/arginine repetitive matrix protein 1-like [Pteropus medius]|uniref:serine/arginine repetitive matrix protein 1-like n=1 Tax=Pteropus vampyrus TaxID=132908 RepID=UPI00196A9DDD|nr:serine/arginine repetitive matrix protein 1-like [Pteropus giganteus]